MVHFIITVFLILLVYPLLIIPKGKNKEELEIFKNRLIAHRGLFSKSANVYENSLSAFLKAKESGLAIELDVHLTLDGKLAVFHDDNFLRMFNSHLKPEDLPLSKIKEFCFKKSNEHVPELKEVLTLINGQVPLLIEIKTMDRRYKKICDTLYNEIKNYSGPVAVQSFYPPAIIRFKRKYPEVLRGILATDFIRIKGKRKLLYIIGTSLCFNFLAVPDFVSYEIRFFDAVPLNIFKMFGGTVFGWTATSKEEIKEAETFFDSVIFEKE